MSRIAIMDLNLLTYTYHSTPQASMYAMLISGYHKARGDTVVLADKYPNPAMFDKIYIIKDRIGVGHLASWLIPDNVIPVGNRWKDNGILSYYNTAWEVVPPDNTIYWNWLDNWKQRYPKYNPDRLYHFYLTPVKVKQGNRLAMPSGSKILILDNDVSTWDPHFEHFTNADLTAIRFTYPIEIDGRWEDTLKYIRTGQCGRQYLYIDMNYHNYTDEDFVQAADTWAKYSLGRMPKLLLNTEIYSHEEWMQAIPRIYKALAEFRMKGGKMVRFIPYGGETFRYERVLKEMKRWTGRGIGYAKNSLFDYMIYDSIRNQNDIVDFLVDPYDYVKKKRQGSNKFKQLIPFIEECPELMELITTSYSRAAG